MVAAPRLSPAVVTRNTWERRYRRTLRLVDTTIVLAACALASAISLAVRAPGLLAEDPAVLVRVPLGTAVLWLVMLSLLSTRESSIIGSGTTEYKRLAHATLFSFGILAILYVLFDWEGIRIQLFSALPGGVLALIIGRWLLRRWLVRQREVGRCTARTLIVGSRDDVEYAIHALGPGSRLGYEVVGAVLTDGDGEDGVTVGGRRIQAVHGHNLAARTAAAVHADTIIIASLAAGDPGYIKRLAWELEGTAADLVLCSRVADVAGPRMSLRPVEGLPLIHVRIPTFDGGSYLIKRAMDVIVSTIALALFAPIAAIIAIAIKLDDGGPVLFVQERVGRDGRTFRMKKFRSMSVGAEKLLAELAAENEGSGPLFKLKEDPRVTRVGAFLRRYSLDELPQFWNSLVGDMSVVGPRPPLPSEVDTYDGTVSRRLYIKPGITGPWQVGGRSDLTWEESVRIDLRYVENWSVMTDLQLIWRTARAMVKPDGAY